MKKILLIHDTFLTKGGAERMNIEIAKILNADIATAVWDKNSFKIEDFDYKCRQILTQKNFKRGMFGFLKMKFSFFWNKKIYQDYSSFFLSNEASSAVWSLPKKSKKIFYAHSVSRHLFDLYYDYLNKVPIYAKIPYKIIAFFLKKIYIAELKKFDIVLTNSQENKNRLKKWCNIDANIIFPPVDIQKFKPILPKNEYKIFQKYKNKEIFLQQIKKDGFYISFSRVNNIKGVDKIINVFKKMPEKNLLIIFGVNDSHVRDFMHLSGVPYNKNQNVILQSEKYKNIFWLSIKENNDLPEIIANTKLTVCMSKNEDFGMIPIESMACGIGVVAPNEGGYKTTIIHKKTGFLLEKNSENCLESFLLAIDDRKIKNIKTACLERANQFGLEIFKKNIIDVKNKIY